MTMSLLTASIERTTTIPDGRPDVGITRLHLDRGTGATTSLVAFPAGWQRLAAGRYLVGEEFVLLTGTLEISGAVFVAGDYAWIPAGALRTGTLSPDGALTLAWFSGPPGWERSDSGAGAITQLHLSTAAVPHGCLPLRGDRAGEGPGRSHVYDGPVTITGPAEVLFVDDWRWLYVEPAVVHTVTGGRVLIRQHG